MSRASVDKKDLKDFEQLFHQLQPRLYAYCCKYVEDNELARDIVQSVSSICGKIMRVYKFLMSFIYLRLYIIVVCLIFVQNAFIRNMQVL